MQAECVTGATGEVLGIIHTGMPHLPCASDRSPPVVRSGLAYGRAGSIRRPLPCRDASAGNRNGITIVSAAPGAPPTGFAAKVPDASTVASVAKKAAMSCGGGGGERHVDVDLA
jgi:hypothetical protein